MPVWDAFLLVATSPSSYRKLANHRSPVRVVYRNASLNRAQSIVISALKIGIVNQCGQELLDVACIG